MSKLSRLRALAEAVRSQVEAVRGGWGSAGAAAAAGASAARRAPARRRWGYALDVLESRLYFSTVSFDGTVTRTAYDALNRPYLSMDRFNPADGPAARGTRSVYDGMGRSIETDRLSGLVIDVTANADGTYSSAVRAGTDQSVLSRGTTVYNPDGTVQKTFAPSIASPAGQETDYTYTPDGQELTVTEKAVPTWAAGALAPQDQTTTYAYDAAGRQRSVTGPRGDVTTFTYDANGNVTKTLFNDGTYITDAYDALGRKSSETDQTGATTDYTYDAAGHLKTVTEPAVTLYDTLAGTSSQVRPVYTYTYDAYGNLQRVDDANHHDTTYTYDALGHQLTRTLPPIPASPMPPSHG